jgi:death-on-curing protein
VADFDDVDYLTVDDLLAAATAALARSPEVRDYGLLDAAVHRPAATVFGEDAYPSLELKAAALLHSLVCNHPLVDGNKRLGWVATRLFLALNDRDLAAPEDDAFDLVMSVADGSVGDLEIIAEALGRWIGR